MSFQPIEIVWIARAAAATALMTAFFFARRILSASEGTAAMKEIAAHVRAGAIAYLKQQYRVIGIVFVLLLAVLGGLVYLKLLPTFVPFALLSGGFWSALAGFLGMSIATRASNRTAAAAAESLNRGLRLAFSAGAVMGLTVVGLALMDLANWYQFLTDWYGSHPAPAGMTLEQAVTSTMLCSAMGASTVALFARIGGGIFTKAADVGADLVGKVEAGIPEDDPRNPATIADNVGDNVGDVAGMGADLFESYVASIVAAMTLGLAAGLGVSGILFPLLLAAVGILASVVGVFLVRCGEETEQSVLLAALRRGVFGSAALIAIGAWFCVRGMLGPEFTGVYIAVLAGLVCGLLIGFGTEYYTSAGYRPTRKLAETALTGPATIIIGGVSLGMLSSIVPVLLVAAAIGVSFYAAGGASQFGMGLYGVGVAAVGLLSTLGITLATDAYGPVADNAGGNAQMTGQPPEVRQRTDALDALGNTTAATGKGMAIAAAALTAMALLVSYRERVLTLGAPMEVSMMNPKVLIGLFLGAALPYLFCALTMEAVGRAAGKVVEEVRRQFREIKGLLAGEAQADHARCVSIVTQAAQREMIAPSLMAIGVPVGVGVLMGPEAVMGLLAGSLVSGFVLAVMMANAGGAWDNAKKYIEEGAHG
ncbi:MAG: sodium-translocating pyrophosphatase, partial [Candidatus Omnitrophica bacterium CG11_big_fil_rev_8_21_14_0_20_64_10]